MKLIDRYIARNLLVPLAYCLAAFIVVVIIQDLFDHLSDFIDGHASFGDVLLYYTLLLPSSMIYIIPVALLLAVLYSLLQMTKNNELTAMRASGVSLYRLMVPYLLVGLAFTIGVLILNETIGPRCAYRASQFLEYQRHAEAANVEREVPFYNPTAGRDWWIQEFNNVTYEMKGIKMTQERADQTVQLKLNAAGGQWLDDTWWFNDVAIQEFDPQGNPVRQYDADGNSLGAIVYEPRREMKDLTETPRDFLNVTKDPEFLTTRELRAFLKAHRHSSRETVARVRVDMNHRMALPWMSFIVILLGIPFGSQTARKGALLGVILSIGLFFGYYFLMNLCLWFGKAFLLAPWLAAWTPNLVFLAVGTILVYRMR